VERGGNLPVTGRGAVLIRASYDQYGVKPSEFRYCCQ
jgi:hypothetical protein